jgi:hypothetical protein
VSSLTPEFFFAPARIICFFAPARKFFFLSRAFFLLAPKYFFSRHFFPARRSVAGVHFFSLSRGTSAPVARNGGPRYSRANFPSKHRTHARTVLKFYTRYKPFGAAPRGSQKGYRTYDVLVVSGFFCFFGMTLRASSVGRRPFASSLCRWVVVRLSLFLHFLWVVVSRSLFFAFFFVGCGLAVPFFRIFLCGLWSGCPIFFRSFCCGLWSVGARFGGFHAEGSAEFRRGTRYVSTADRQKHLLLIV